MLCSSSTLARPDWLCNGNWRFITPAGVANHRRREAWGGGERWAEAGCMSVQRWLPLTDYTHSPGLPTGTQTDTQAHTHANMLSLTWHTCKHMYASFNTTAVLGGCAEEIAYFLLPFLLFGGFCLVCVRGWKQAHKNREAETEKWIRRWPKITIRMKRKRGCVSTAHSRFASNWMKDHREEGRAEGQEDSRTVLLH